MLDRPRFPPAVGFDQEHCNDPATLIQRGHQMQKAGYPEEAVRIAHEAAALTLRTASSHDALGTLFSLCDDPASALAFFERAVRMEPFNCGFQYNLATAYRMLGNIDAAEACLVRVLKSNPADVSAYHMLSDLRTQTKDNNHIRAMRGMLSSVRRGSMDEIVIRFALSKELEDIHDYARSFEHLSAACALYRRRLRYDVYDDIHTMQRLVHVHRDQQLAANSDCPLDEPVFVLGLPRTGTTLVDRILCGHSQLSSVGESLSFPLACIRTVQRGVEHTTKLEFVNRSWAVDPAALGIRYLRSVHATRSPTTGRFVDKQPMNMLYAGLIHRALPRARFVLVMRDPMDACYALFKTLFVGAHPYSYDFHDLGHYFAAWTRLARHWQNLLGDRLLVVEYENLVTHSEAVARQIISHCGLPWESTCLDSHLQRSAVTTASAVQVRQPIHTSSVGKWRHYQKQLRLLRALLENLEPPSGWNLYH